MTLSGVYVPLITPFDGDGAVAFPTLEALAHEVLDAGAAGIVALGTTAEPTSLSAAERRGVVDVIARVCREHSARLLVGASTVEAVRELRGRSDVTAALSLVPPFLRPGEAGVIAHFTALAAASPVPLVIYHVPYRTGQDLPADAIRRLAGIPGVAGIKYSVGGIGADTVELLADPPADFAVLGGDDVFISPLLALGAQGGILASAHVATARYVELADAWHADAAARARTLGHRLALLSGALFAEPNPTVIKAVLHAQGRIPSAAVRLPLLPAGSASVRAALRHVETMSGLAPQRH
ncbi:4-hydroxy-tetrahydrodipicolinate synthase [Planotetraspora phitsanulokensis]|uniref:4-hydroxy-tetrahydrodipicolinate synthase 2 n=1 Tax=Planotetraspora phitsanulokensis TaxID=575192 RepID=A0A8J3XHK7_9ACTN|nr:dihydrodipicolinate synthase family protein [Planotetraspora phitsanulokensis]GII36678.1 4-hydroxy-tetrahydrodipicolinate synthase 2 [Planotetraspora phitsanulokensis]